MKKNQIKYKELIKILFLIFLGIISFQNGFAQIHKDTVQSRVILDYMPPPGTAPDSTNMVHTVVQEPPKFLNGDVNKYFNDTITFPFDTKAKQGIGRVVVSFVVEKNGSISDIVILRTSDTILNKEAIKIVAASKWTPGKQNGKIVRTEVMKAVSFKVLVSPSDSAMKK